MPSVTVYLFVAAVFIFIFLHIRDTSAKGLKECDNAWNPYHTCSAFCAERRTLKSQC